MLKGLYPSLTAPVVANASLEKFEYLYGRNTTCPRLGPLQRMLQDMVIGRRPDNKNKNTVVMIIIIILK